MILEDENSKEQRKKKKKTNKTENPTFPIDEDGDLQQQMEEKGETKEAEQTTFAMEERALKNQSLLTDPSLPQPIVMNIRPSTAETTVPPLPY